MSCSISTSMKQWLDNNILIHTQSGKQGKAIPVQLGCQTNEVISMQSVISAQAGKRGQERQAQKTCKEM